MLTSSTLDKLKIIYAKFQIIVLHRIFPQFSKRKTVSQKQDYPL
jgi:hypothetical protein